MIPELDSLGEVRILVVGDLMVDEYVYGDIERISPEAPVAVVQGKHHEMRVGGAGSVVTNLAALGIESSVIGLVGDDEGGGFIRQALHEAGCSVDGLVVSQSRPTSRKTRILAGVQHSGRGQQQVLRLDREELRATDDTEQAALIGAIGDALEEAPDVVLISDYEKGLLEALRKRA